MYAADFLDEEKGYHRGTGGTGDLLFIHQHIPKERKAKQKYNYGVDYYKKANDMVSQTWIIDCVKMYKISDKVIKFITESMKNLKVELTVGGITLAEVKIQKGIFQRDTFSSLLFVIAMMPFNYILRN